MAFPGVPRAARAGARLERGVARGLDGPPASGRPRPRRRHIASGAGLGRNALRERIPDGARGRRNPLDRRLRRDRTRSGGPTPAPGRRAPGHHRPQAGGDGAGGGGAPGARAPRRVGDGLRHRPSGAGGVHARSALSADQRAPGRDQRHPGSGAHRPDDPRDPARIRGSGGGAGPAHPGHRRTGTEHRVHRGNPGATRRAPDLDLKLDPGAGTGRGHRRHQRRCAGGDRTPRRRGTDAAPATDHRARQRPRRHRHAGRAGDLHERRRAADDRPERDGRYRRSAQH